MRWLSLVAVFDVSDSKGQPLGRVEEKPTLIIPVFRIFSPANVILAEATLTSFGTTYNIVDPLSNKTIATLHRDFFRLKDDWTVKIVNRELFIQKNIDPRLFILITAFQTDREAWKKQINSSSRSSADQVFQTDTIAYQPDLNSRLVPYRNTMIRKSPKMKRTPV